MMVKNVFSVSTLLEQAGEEFTRSMLSTFSCVKAGKQLNEEVETFVKDKAIGFYKRKMSVTYLVNDEDDLFSGIFTLTHKAIDIPSDNMSNTQKRKMDRFASFDSETNKYRVSAFLIAQFGKNYSVNEGKSISGTELMDCTMSVLHDAQEMVGGGLVYLECEAQSAN